ncbi:MULTISPECIES: hypothetical protein [Nocardiopsis]|uniref:hypothetical protein n=1 Tax=Nocardiopsis TaxID=2013 RepID=UPI00117C72E5|nr:MULTISPECIES: hypothetical protein [Nocardiopsis]
MDGAARPWRRQARKALAWTGVGLLVGALALAAVTAALNRGRYEDGLLEETGGWWLVSAVVALVVLSFGVRWQVRHPRVLDDDPRGRGRVFWLSLCALGVGYLAFAGFPADAFQATAEGAWQYDPSPAAAGMWLVVCMVALGCLLMLSSARPPRLLPLRRSLPFAAAGVFAVVLAGGLVEAVVFPREPHTVAEGNGDPAPVPEAVGRVGWSWAPPMGVRIEEVRAGTHGPLVLLDDGAVSLDGTTGEELWSFRRPRDWGGSAWADDEHVYVRYAHGAPPEEETPADVSGEPVERTTVVLDIATGEVVGESTALEPGEGKLVAMTPEARIERFRADSNGEFVLGATSLEGEEELWSRTLAAPGEGRMCRHGALRRYADLLVVLYGCATEPPDGAGYEDFQNLFMSREVRVEVTVTAVDVATGEEAWRYGWETEPDERSPDLVEGRSPAGDGTPVIVLERPGGDPELLLLDAATGERLDHLPGFVLDGDGTGSETYGGVVRIDTEGSVVHEAPRGGALIHRADASGEITATADLGDINVGTAVDDVVALEDMALVPRMRGPLNRDDQQVELAVAPFGGSVTWETARWIDPGGRLLTDMLAVPGAVVLHTDGDYGDYRSGEGPLVEGLVP